MMAVKSALKLLKPAQFYRKFSTDVKLTNVTVNDKTGVAILTLQRPPVNSLNFELLTEIAENLGQLEKNKCRGLILTSSSNKVFSAGLDILEMYKPKPDRLNAFWTSLQETWIRLFGSTYPTVAVINGHSPAGGCLLSMSCEYRIMLNNFTIGLNETQLGITAPTWFVDTMRNTIGDRQTELSLTQGRLYQTEEALKIGLIDEIATTKEEGIQKAEQFLSTFARISPQARTASKLSIRGPILEKLIKNREADCTFFKTFVGNDKVQKGLEIYLESLKKKSA